MLHVFIKPKSIQKRQWYIGSVLIVVFLGTVSYFLPFENLFIKFDSPEKAYNYVNSETVKLVVPGENSAFVLGKERGGGSTYAIVPKSGNVWKVWGGSVTKMRRNIVQNKILVIVYQYKNTDDYYVWVTKPYSGKVQIEDSRNSTFLFLEEKYNQENLTNVDYYAYVPRMDSTYWVSINGEKIVPFDEKQ